MADRYWVGGSGNWDGSTTTHWSTTSGGAGGSSAPTSSDNAILDTLSNATGYTVTLVSGAKCLNATFGAPLTGNITVAGSTAFGVYGDFTFPASNLTLTYTGQININNTTTCNLNFNGNTLASIINIGASGTITLLSSINTSKAITIGAGTLTVGANNITCTTFTNAGADLVSMGSGLWTLTGTGSVFIGYIENAETANIVLSNTTTASRTFTGGPSVAYNKLTIGGTTGVSITVFSQIAGIECTFTELASTKTVAHTLTFSDGTTTSIGTWSINGTSGNVVTLNSVTPTVQYTLNKTGGGTVTADYLNIRDSAATPGSTWTATNSIDSGNNTGWTITPPVSTATGNFLMLF